MTLHPGYHSKGNKILCRLFKSLYGLKKTPSKWIEKGHMTWNDENTPACKARGAPKYRKIMSNDNKD